MAAQIPWSGSRADSPARPADLKSARRAEARTEGLAESDWRWLRTMFRVGTLTIALFQAAYIAQPIYLDLPAPLDRTSGKRRLKRPKDTAATPPVPPTDAGTVMTAQAASLSRTSSPAVLAPQAATRPLRILLAEDSPDNRLLITAYLKRHPYQIEAAENGKVAVAKFRSGRYDLVLMDIQMPVMDGYAAVRAIRAWETEHRVPPTPILALTASTLDDDIRRAFEAGCNTHIAKPVRKATLLAAIDETLTLVAADTALLTSAPPLAPNVSGPAHARVNIVPH